MLACRRLEGWDTIVRPRLVSEEIHGPILQTDVHTAIGAINVALAEEIDPTWNIKVSRCNCQTVPVLTCSTLGLDYCAFTSPHKSRPQLRLLSPTSKLR